MRAARDWSDYHYPLNSTQVNPLVEYGALGGFLELLPPGAYV